MTPLLEVKNLSITLQNKLHAVRDISFTLNRGEVVGIVGESGSGKSLTVQSILQLLPKSSIDKITGEILFQRKNLLTASFKELKKIRGKEIGIIFQDPFSSLNPLMKIGKQILEPLLLHHSISKKEGVKRVLEMLHLVGISDPKIRYHQYPHELSGGLRQRAMIALALITQPQILIADEPTTALDVTVQAQILSLLKKFKNISILFISHDLAVVSQMCDRIMVMYAGRVVEMGKSSDLLEDPQHPYTKMLVESHPAYQKGFSHKTLYRSSPKTYAHFKGCAFLERCPYRMQICKEKDPHLKEIRKERSSACFLHDEERQKKTLSHLEKELCYK